MAILPLIIDFIRKLIGAGKKLTPAQADKLNHVIYLCHELETGAVAAGCTPGGTPPPQQAAPPDIWGDGIPVVPKVAPHRGVVPAIALACLLAASAAYAQPPQAPLPPQHPTLAAKDACPCGGKCGADCKCQQEDCLLQKINNDYRAAYWQAMKEGKPLLIWVGYFTPTGYDTYYPEVVGCYQPTFEGSSVSRLVVALPDGNEMWPVGTFTQKNYSANAVKAAIAKGLPAQQRAQTYSFPSCSPPVQWQEPARFGAPFGFGGGSFGGGACRGGG